MLDSTLFEIIPDSESNKGNTDVALSTARQNPDIPFRLPAALRVGESAIMEDKAPEVPLQANLKPTAKQSALPWDDEDEYALSFQNDLADLEAWLQSDAVEIVD